MSAPTRIVISPDAPAVLAARLVRRLQRDGLVPAGVVGSAGYVADRFTEALADEIHAAAVDGTLGGSS